MPGLVVRRRQVGVSLFNGLRCTPAAVVAVEVAPRDGGRCVELVLRDGLVTPDELKAALELFAGARDQRERRRAVITYADNPWSGGERQLHELLRCSNITGWVANPPLRVFGFLYHPDVLFEVARLILEFDGFGVHGTRKAFENDRLRQNRLVLADYRVLRITWERLQLDPDGIVAEIRLALREPEVC